MVKKLLKKSLSERQLEKILRANQFVKDSGLLKKGLKILPPLNLRVANELTTISPISSITINGWASLIKLYDKANETERADFRESVRNLILSDINSVSLLETGYIADIFSEHRSMYLEFLGTAYYVKGELKKAFEAFKEYTKLEPSDTGYMYMARCTMHFGQPNEVIDLLLKGLQLYPNSDIIVLSLASAYYRSGQTSAANESLLKLSKESADALQHKAANIDILDKEIKDALANKTIVRPVEKLGLQLYTEDSVKDYWETLFFHFTCREQFQHGWSDLCYITVSKIENYLHTNTDIKTVLNFGVFCGVPDYKLAVKHPAISFVGVDREVVTKNLNERAFKEDNLSFHALDMIDIIYEDRTEVKNFLKDLVTRQGEVMIFHARTATLIYPEAIRKFYKACATLGVKYIALYENMCLSRTHLKYFDFENLPADTIPYFSIMQIHNYRKYLEEAGYEITEKEIWGYSSLLWEGKDMWGTNSNLGLGDGHVALIAKLQ